MTTAAVTTPDGVRRRNLAAVLGHVHARGPTSRAALTSLLGLNRSTIGGLTAQLEGLGLVREQAPVGPRRTGRPSPVVVPRSADVTVLAVDVGVDAMDVARVGLGGVVLDRRERRHVGGGASGGHGMRAVVEAVAASCRGLLAGRERRGAVLGVGASVPGVVRASDGLVRYAPNLGWVDEPFAAALADALGLPVRAGNDADLGVLAEHLRGAAVGVDDAVYLSAGVGVGGGLLVGGVPLRGWGGYAGEVGHLPLHPGGRRCRCGARGCWETEVGEDRLLEAAGRPAGGGLAAVHEVAAAARAGEARAAGALDEVARWTGVGLAAVVDVLDPQVVVLGGVLGVVHRERPDVVREALRASTITRQREPVRLVEPGLGADSTLLGAAELAFAPLLADPASVAAGLAPAGA